MAAAARGWLCLALLLAGCCCRFVASPVDAGRVRFSIAGNTWRLVAATRRIGDERLRRADRHTRTKFEVGGGGGVLNAEDALTVVAALRASFPLLPLSTVPPLSTLRRTYSRCTVQCA